MTALKQIQFAVKRKNNGSIFSFSLWVAILLTAVFCDKFSDEINGSLDQVASYPDSDKKTVMKACENTSFWIAIRWKIQVLCENEIYL